MTRLLVEANPTRIESEDMTAIIGLLGHLAGTVETAEQRSEEQAPEWTLYVHWLADEPLPESLVAGLPSAAVRVRDHFKGLRKDPPARLSVLDRDERMLSTVEV
ncbi:hypothetical protein [Kitasatospora sp. NBC_00315]|uniref:hypothetical protein n=1 Tax=Kitasatospora sp. NBC_00315 TaxID=2975963 RepID=UPI003243A8F8